MGLVNLSSPLSGLQAAATKMAVSAGNVARVVDDPESPNVDYAAEFVAQIVGQTAFDANVATAKAELGLLDKLLDIKI